MLKTLWRWTKLIIGWSWVVFAALGGIGIWTDIAAGKETPGGVFVVIGMVAVAGGALLRSAYKKDPAAMPAVTQPVVRPVETIERQPPAPSLLDQILECAAQHDGKVTITDCASDLGLAFGAARDALEAMVKAKECTSEMTTDGRVVYDFGEALRRRPIGQRLKY